MKNKDLLSNILELHYSRKNLVGHYYDDTCDQYHIFNYAWAWAPSKDPVHPWKQKLIVETVYNNRMKRIGHGYHMSLELKKIV